MRSVRDVAEAAMLAVPTKASILNVAKWVSDRYQDLTFDTRLRHLRRVGELKVDADITAGTVTTTTGSNIVVGDSTARTAWDDLGGGWGFRVEDYWYDVAGTDSNGDLILSADILETGDSGLSYVLANRYLKLPSEARKMNHFYQPRKEKFLERVSMEYLDHNYPKRKDVKDTASYWAEHVSAEDGSKQIEIYPYLDRDELFRYVYWVQPSTLGLDDLIPEKVPPVALKEGVIVDILRFNAFNAVKNTGEVDVAGLFRNDYRAQETKWREEKQKMSWVDTGSEDKTVVVRPLNHYGSSLREIRTAREDIYDRDGTY